MLAVHGLCKSFGDVAVYNDVSFTVAAGEAVAVVGANGSGKSTLLRCLVGAEEFDDGGVLFRDGPFDETSAEVRAGVASLLDDVDFFPDISVVEHLRIFAWLHGASEDVVGELGLDAVRDQLPPTLSSGQRHRLGLASCFVRPRRLLVLDEPEQRLDAQGREWLRGKLIAEKAAGGGRDVRLARLDYNFASVDFGAFGPTPVGLIVQLSRGPALLVVLAWLQVAVF